METQERHGPGNPGKLPMYLSPYELWNFGAGQGYAFPAIHKHPRFIGALAELGTSPDEGSRGAALPVNTWVPTLWRRSKLSFIPFVVAKPLGTVESAEELQDVLRSGFDAAMVSIEEPLSSEIRTSRLDARPRFRVSFPVADAAMNENAKGELSDPEWHSDETLYERIGHDKRITIVAVIDDGLPFAHRNFRDITGERTRVEFCWLQSVAFDRNQKSVLFGREYTRPQIEGYITQYGDDEDTLYRKAGATAETEDLGSLLDRRATHGAHVMDLATGYAPERGEVPPEEIRIIAVQLPNTVNWDTSGFGKDMYMLSAFHYIFDRADRIARAYGIEKPRLVINFSYGFSGGRHDGEIELEAAINELVAKRRANTGPTALVLPAGNTFLDPLHGMIRSEDFVEDAATFHWRIQPNDRTPSYLELWFSKGFDPTGYKVEVLDPWDRLRWSLPIGDDPAHDPAHKTGDPGIVLALLNAKSVQVGQLSADKHRAEVKTDQPERGRWRVLVAMAPTEPEDARLPGIESGRWTIVIRRGEGAGMLDQPIHCWIQRAADPESLRSGSRQSYFDDLKDIRYNLDGDLGDEDTKGAFVERFGSLNGLATGHTSLIVAGYRLGAGLGSSLEDARPALYSAAGALEYGWPEAQVACSSMSDRSRVLTGTLAAGVRSGARSYVQGTSTAAPFVARRLATVFVTADNKRVQDAETKNYLPLLSDRAVQDSDEDVAGSHQDLTRKRLGAVRVSPHWQPSLEPCPRRFDTVID
jgi:hypothetical protein